MFRLEASTQAARKYVAAGGIRADAIAGLVTGSVLVPQSMSYALLANLPPQHGIYSSISLVVYFLVGGSPYLSVAPVAVSSLLVGGYTSTLATSTDAAQAASTIAFFCGLFQLGFAITRLGGLFSTWLSKTMMVGYSTGVALTILISQLPSAFGLNSTSSSSSSFPVVSLVNFLASLDKAKPVAFGFFAVPFALLVLAQRALKPRLRPALRFLADLAVLAVIVVGTSLSYVVVEVVNGGGEGNETLLPLVGNFPAGLAAPALPNLAATEPGAVAIAVAISIVAFSEGYSVASSLASRPAHDGDGNLSAINPNREFFAVGLCNLASSMFTGYVVSGGMGRTMVNVNSGAVSQWAGLVAFAVTVLCAYVAAPAIQYIPKALLSAVIMSAVMGMVKTGILLQTWRISRMDFAVAASTTLAVVGIGPMYGLAYGVAVSLAFTLYSMATPYTVELGEMRNMLRNLKRYPDESKRIPGVVIVRIDSPLFFANVQRFFARCKEMMDEHAQAMQSPAQPQQPIRAFLVDASGIGFIDTASLHELLKFQQFLAKKDIALVLAEVRGPVRDAIDRYNKATRETIAPFYEHLPLHAPATSTVGDASANAVDNNNTNQLTCFSVHTLEEALAEICARPRPRTASGSIVAEV